MAGMALTQRPERSDTFSGMPKPRKRPRGTALASARLPLPLLMLVLALVFPITMAVYVGTTLFTPFRVIMIGLVISALVTLVRGKRINWNSADLMMVLFAAWTCVCIIRNFDSPTERLGQFLLESAAAYFVVRLYLDRFAHNIQMIKLMFVIACFAALIAIPESIFHSRFFLQATDLGLGIPYEQAIGRPVFRMELLRAHSFFSHPILYGLFCANCIALVWYTSQPRAAFVKMLVLGAAVFFSLSSAPLLAMNLQIALIAYESFTRFLTGRFKYLLTAAAVAAVFLQTFTGGGVFGVMINYLTFNQISSYNRVNIWKFGWQNIFENPIFGLVPETWFRAPWMKESIDNFWIYSTMLGGIPALALLSIAIILIMRRFYRAPGSLLPAEMRRFRLGWSFSFIALALAGFSVMLFGQMQPLFYMMLGMAASTAHLFDLEAVRRAKARKASMRAQAEASNASVQPATA